MRLGPRIGVSRRKGRDSRAERDCGRVFRAEYGTLLSGPQREVVELLDASVAIYGELAEGDGSLRVRPHRPSLDLGGRGESGTGFVSRQALQIGGRGDGEDITATELGPGLPAAGFQHRGRLFRRPGMDARADGSHTRLLRMPRDKRERRSKQAFESPRSSRATARSRACSPIRESFLRTLSSSPMDCG